MSRCRVFAGLLLLANACPAAQWSAIPAASALRFVASYEGESAPGEFRRFDLQLERPASGWSRGRLSVVVDVGSADMYSDDVNAAITEPEWLDVAHHPRAVFESTDIAPQGDQRFLARGTLRLKGAAREVAVPFVWRRLDAGTALMRGELTLRRTDFAIGTGEWADGDVIGLGVKVEFEVTLRVGAVK